MRQALGGFAPRLGAVAAGGLLVRVAYVLIARRSVEPVGDAFFYHYGANLIADGHGWINPFDFILSGIVEQSADHPPFYLAYLAGWSWLGLDGPVAHMLVSCLLGAATVVLCGLLGRTLAGERAGLLAAAAAAVYPNLWVWDGMLLSETTAAMMVTGVVLAAYWVRATPSPRRAAVLGALLGLAALTRAEALLLSVLVVVPLMLGRPGPWRQRAGHLALSGLCCIAVLMPWVAFNLSRFDQPVYLSAGFEVTLATATCDRTWYGPLTGYWSLDCAIDVLDREGLTVRNSDQSERSAAWRDSSRAYIRDHLGRAPVVVLARWGRVAHLFRPRQAADLEILIDGKERAVAYAGVASFYAVALAAAGGVLVLRRRSVPVYPLLGPLAAVVVTVAVTFGQSRYRASAEGVLAVLAAVGAHGALDRVRPTT